MQLIAALPRPGQPGVRYTPREQWHVTLRFFAEAEFDEVDRALGGLMFEEGEAVMGPAVQKLGQRVVAIPVSGLDAIAEAVNEATSGIGSPPDDRPFRGHITVARLKRRGSCAVVGRAITGRFRVARLTLVRSVLGSAGARHEDLMEYPSRPG
ncbi:MAG: hypothetical protein EDR02_08305 [Actinobacteria bacterium]|nr:MAG: hypothetical protein EDR02_08305 [Actinomycetota bacterium]RIK08502.1 MAG: hypothetical protein DCC48_00700 [Acidobacteriota bacterium]